MSTAGILVLAGIDGAGKSSIAGTILNSRGGVYYNPDAAARRFVEDGLSLDEANSRAWHRGLFNLDRAIRERRNYAFETTLGGRTITQRLIQAARMGTRVRVWYVGLSSLKIHLMRVKSRVAHGGEYVSEDMIRERWNTSRENLIRLLPHLDELALFDNSRDSVMTAKYPPTPFHILHMVGGSVPHLAPTAQIPNWCKPMVAAAMRVTGL